MHILSIVIRNRLRHFIDLRELLVSNSKKTKGIRWLAAVPMCLLPLAFLDFSGNYLDAYSARALFCENLS